MKKGSTGPGKAWPRPRRPTAIGICKFRVSSRMEVIETRPQAHGVMPRHWKRPPDHSAQNALPDGERNDVAFAGKEPRHGDSADEGERNQDWIRPVKRGENCAREQRGTQRAVRRPHEPIR